MAPGKTTLLKSIAGILDFDSGEILVDGKSIKSEPLAAKSVMAYIPDNPDVYETLTGIQYLNFVADIFGIASGDRRIAIEKYAKTFELADVLNHPISTYSHGMKQKLVVMSALVHKPKIFILDEPFVGLDPKAAYLLKEIFHEMCAAGSLIFFRRIFLKSPETVQQGRDHQAGEDRRRRRHRESRRSSLESVFLELIEK